MRNIQINHFGEDYAKISVDGEESEIGIFEATIIKNLLDALEEFTDYCSSYNEASDAGVDDLAADSYKTWVYYKDVKVAQQLLGKEPPHAG